MAVTPLRLRQQRRRWIQCSWYRAGAGKRTANGCGCIGEENSAQAWDGVIGFDQSSLLCDREQCAEIVEQIDEEEYEDNFKQADVESTTNIQAESGGGDAGKIVRSGMPLDEADGPRKSGSCEYSDEN